MENTTENGSSRAVCSAASPVCMRAGLLVPFPTQALVSAPEPTVPGAQVSHPPRDPRVQPLLTQLETSATVTGQRPLREPLHLPFLYFPSQAEPSRWPPSNLLGAPHPRPAISSHVSQIAAMVLAPQRTVSGKRINRFPLGAASVHGMETPTGRRCSTCQSESSWDKGTGLRGTHTGLRWTSADLRSRKVDVSGKGTGKGQAGA